MKISEKTLRHIIRESLGELNSFQLRKAVDKSPEIARTGTDAFYRDRGMTKRRATPFDWEHQTAANGIAEIREVLDAYEESYHGYGDAPVKKCQEYLDYIEEFLLRKQKQQTNMSDRYEDLTAEEQNAYYTEVGKMFGLPYNYNTNLDNKWKMENAIDDAVRNLSDEEWENLLSQLSDRARDYAENYV